MVSDAELIELAKAAARREDISPRCATLGLTSGGGFLALARACGAALLSLEETDVRREATLVELRLAVQGYRQVKRRLKSENEALRSAVEGTTRRMIGADGGLSHVLQLADRVARAPIPVLVTGETGTGKEVLARYVHDRGPRADGPFIAVNCGAIPETLMESELFGIERGTATGVEQRVGRFEQAHGGTIFLDEVADMPASMQVKLLRVLQEREVERVGARTPVKVDVRVISATNKDPRAEVAAKRFREDLYYRLVGVEIHLPALRERGDIEALALHFLEETARRFHRSVTRFSAEALHALRTYPWPGNVRELIVEVERAVALAETDTVALSDLTPRVAHPGAATAAATPGAAPGSAAAAVQADRPIRPLRESRKDFEREEIQRALAHTGGMKRRAAKLLDFSPEGLRRKMLELGLSAPAAPDSHAADDDEPD